MIQTESLRRMPESVRLDQIREGLNSSSLHIAGELHTGQEFNPRSGGYSVSRSRFIVAPRNATAESLGEMNDFAQGVLSGDEGVYRWNQNSRVYDSTFGQRLLFGKLYAGELLDQQRDGARIVEEHSRSIEVVVMPDAVLADIAMRISEQKLAGSFNPQDLELVLATESVPYNVFRAGVGSLREYAMGLGHALEQYRQTVNG